MSAASLAEQLCTSPLPIVDERRAPPQPAALSSCVCVRACPFFLSFSSFPCALGKSFGRALVHHGGDKNGPGTPEGRERDRGTFFFFFSFRINPEDAMCRSETGHHISCCCCCCCCRHKGTAQRAEKTEVEGQKKSAKRLLGCRRHRAAGTTAPDDDGAWAFRGDFDAQSRI